MSRLVARYRKVELDAEAARKVVAAVEAGQARPVPRAARGATPSAPRAAEGDPRRMRGVPIFARGVASTMVGTDPLAALIWKETREERRRS